MAPPTRRLERRPKPAEDRSSAELTARFNPIPAEVNVNMDNEKNCPVTGRAHTSRSNRDWWPNQLVLKVLSQNPPMRDPMGAAFNHAEEFKTLDLDALKKDIEQVMTTPQDWSTTAGLVFGSNSELRALAEVYACDDAKEKWCATSWPRGTR